VNAAGREMRELDRDAAISGSDVQLTIDAGCRTMSRRGWRRKRGRRGDGLHQRRDAGARLRADLRPNLFVRGISVADYRLLNEDPYRPLANKATQGLYPPGSTYKMIVALAALEAGVIEPGRPINCPATPNWATGGSIAGSAGAWAAWT
jgi:penicillin-binding protein 2